MKLMPPELSSSRPPLKRFEDLLQESFLPDQTGKKGLHFPRVNLGKPGEDFFKNC